jgi:hypothetical protein
MRIASVNDAAYTAKYHQFKAEFYYKDTLQTTIEITTLQLVKETLNNWARLKIPVADIFAFQSVSKSFVGCTIDDVQYTPDRKSFTIKGKEIEHI